MNNILKAAAAIAAVTGMLGANVALAATTVSFAPAAISVKAGQQVTLTVGVNPAGVKNYTVKTALKFPADLLEVSSFAFAPSWIALAQPGYDLVDNAAGTLIKTAGYPAGTATQTAFGAITFKAKKTGTGSIALTAANSLALDAQNLNQLASAPAAVAVSVTGIAAAPVAQPVAGSKQTAPAPVTGTQGQIPAQTVSPQGQVGAPTVAPAPTTVPAQRGFLAQAITLGTGSTGVGVAVVAAILAAIGYGIYRWKLKQ